MVLIDKLSIIVNRGSWLLSEAVVLKIESIIANFVKQIYKNKRSPEQTVTAWLQEKHTEQKQPATKAQIVMYQEYNDKPLQFGLQD